MATQIRETLTARELAEIEYGKEQQERFYEHELAMKSLDLEVQKLEASWRAWLKIPLALIFLPVKICLAFAVVIGLAFGRNFPDALWDLIGSHRQ
jgi:hypothetical protein